MDIQNAVAAATKIKEHAKKYGIIKSAQNNEDIQLLLNLLHNANNGDKVVQILKMLVQENIIAYDFLVNECISAVAMGKPLQNIVRLLLHVIVDVENIVDIEVDSSVPSQHPLTRVYINNPERIQHIMLVVQEFLFTKLDNRTINEKGVSKCIFPLVKYVIDKGQHVDCLIFAVLDISSTLVLFNEHSFAMHLVCYSVESFKNHKHLKQYANIYMPAMERLTGWLIGRKANLFDGDENSLGFDLICLHLVCCWYLHKDKPVFKSLFLIKCLIKRAAQESNVGTLNINGIFDEILFICTMMLCNCCDSEKYQLLQIVFDVVPWNESCFQKRYLYMPLLSLALDNQSSEDFKINFLARKILSCLNDAASNHEQEGLKKVSSHGNILIYGEIMAHVHNSLKIMQSFKRNHKMIIPWLKDLEYSCTKDSKIIKDYEMFVLADLLLSNNLDIYPQLMSCLASIAKNQPEIVQQILPIFLHILNEKQYRSIKLIILHSLPNFAVSKETLPMILKLIMTLSTNMEIFPLAIHLIVKLWRKQPRVYPYVHQFLTKQIMKDSVPSMIWYDWLIARVTAVWKVCKNNSVQYGEEMVLILSGILEEIIKIDEKDQKLFKSQITVALSLLVESLKEICLSLVIDVESIWKAVIIKVLSVFSKSCVILKSICSLLAAVPSCTSNQNEAFVDEVLQYLWHLTMHQNTDVENSAYLALSNFHPANMRVKYLPNEIKDTVCENLQKLNMDEEAYNPLEESIPGYAYILLLHKVSPQVYSGLEALLKKVLEDEVINLPRGIGKISHYKQLDTRSIEEIPSKLLKQQYDRNTRPAVLSGLAAGLLCCYQPTVHGIDVENPSNKHLIQLKETSKQMLEHLLNDFTIQQNDWYHAMFASKSWKHFMQKIILVFQQGRQAELDEQKARGEFPDDEDYQTECKSILYWVRDSITDILRKASKGSPRVQGNSILALVGLSSALVLHENESELKKESADQYITFRHWLLKVADTVILVFDGKYQAKCKPFQWCQQVSSANSSASSFLSRCAAAISFSELVHGLLLIDAERLITMVELLKTRIPGQPKSGSSLQMDVFAGIGFGLLLAKLHEEQFQNIAGEKARLLLINCLELSRKIVLDNSLQNKDGIVVGFGITISSLLKFDSRKDSQVFALNSHKELKHLIESMCEKDVSETCIGPITVAFAMMTSQALLTNSISLDEFCTCYENIRNKTTEKAPATYSALGIFTFVILKRSISKESDIATKDMNDWKDILSKKNSNILNKTCAVRSIASLFGIELSIVNNTSRESLNLSSYSKLLVKLTSVNTEDIISNIAAKVTGLIHMTSESSSAGNFTVPVNYDYLKSSSLLRYVFNALSEASTTGPHATYNNDKLSVLLSTLVNSNSRTLPPVNWTLVLSPLLELNYSISIKTLCLQFALKHIQKSVNIALWVSSWLQPNSFMKLAQNLQWVILSHVTSLLPNISNTAHKFLLKETPLFLLKKSSGYDINLTMAFETWINALTMSEPPQSTVSHILSAFKDIKDLVTKWPIKEIKEKMFLFTKCIHLLLGDNWRSFHDILRTKSSQLEKYFLIESMNHVKTLDPCDVIYLIDRIEKDDLRHLLEIIFTRRKPDDSYIANVLSQLKQRDTNQERFTTVEEILYHFLLTYQSDERANITVPNHYGDEDLFALVYGMSKRLNSYLI